MKIYIIMLDTHRTRIALVHENEHIPYRRRLVEIVLTPEQEALLQPLCVGTEGGNDVFEEYGPAWFQKGDSTP